MIAESAVQQLSHQLAELTDVHAVPAASLRRTTELATMSVTGCRCAALTVFDGPEPVCTVASHPEAAVLIEAQHRDGQGPEREAVSTGLAVYVRDTVAEQRWPRFRAVALRYGVRCSLTLALGGGASRTAFSLYATRPCAFAGPEVSVAVLLGGQANAAQRNIAAYDAARTALRQTYQRGQSRPVIEQAKALMMRSLGCDEQAAFDELSRISQRCQVKLIDVARQLVRRAASQRA